MRIFRGFDNLPDFRCGVATIGSFDGVHCGHRTLLDRVRNIAEEVGGESIILTFDPHPRITLGKADNLRLLSSTEEKMHLLEAEGIDNVIIIPFTEEFSKLSPTEFLQSLLIEKVGIGHLVVGYNHHFGHNKEGNHSFLLQHGALQVVEVAQYTDNGNKVSSTTIRKAVGEGDMVLARQLLGHTYIIIGIADDEGVVTTDRYKLLPSDGHYACTINGVESECEVCGGVVKQRVCFSEKIEILL